MNPATGRPKWIEVAAFMAPVIMAIILLLFRTASDGILEMGDGVNHYCIAKYAWQHPILFLDLWGKPLFTLLASPFTVGGLVGMTVFNLVVAVITAWVGVRALRCSGGISQVAFSILVLSSPQYLLTVFSGMTEPLFGLLTCLTILLLLSDRPAYAAIVASLTPLARPEYVVFLPMVAFWLVLDRRWRAVPWLAFGLAVYALLALEFHGHVLWFWLADPYGFAGDVYGSGPWDFFVSRAEEVYGRPLLVLGIAALVLWPVVHHFDSARKREHRLFLFVACFSALGIFVVHSVLWYKGLRGSAGLLRVLATGVPLTALFVAFTLGRGCTLLFAKAETRLVLAALSLTALVAWSVEDLSLQVDLPIRIGSAQQVLETASRGVQLHLDHGERVFSTHPYIAYGVGLDPFDQSVYHPVWKLGPNEISERFKEGDLLLWDSQLGSNESAIPLERLLDDNQLRVLEVYEPRYGSKVLGGYVHELFLFEKRDAIRRVAVDTILFNGKRVSALPIRVDTLPSDPNPSSTWTFSANEFPFDITALPLPGEDEIYDVWSVTGRAKLESGQELRIVLKQHVGKREVRYDQEEIGHGRFEYRRRVPRVECDTEQNLYFWSTGGNSFNVEDLTVIRERWSQQTVE